MIVPCTHHTIRYQFSHAVEQPDGYDDTTTGTRTTRTGTRTTRTGTKTTRTGTRTTRTGTRTTRTGTRTTTRYHTTAYYGERQCEPAGESV